MKDNENITPSGATHEIDNLLGEEENFVEKSEVEFSSYAIIIFWLLPGLFGLLNFTLLTQFGEIWFWWVLFVSLQAAIRRKSIPILNSFFHNLSKIFFGARFTQNNKDIPRIWWFITFGSFISFGLITLLVIASIFVIPLLIIIYKREQVLRLFYILSFLPRREYLVYQDPEVIEKRKAILGQYDKSAREYMIFIKPSFLTNLTTFVLILILPLIFALGLIIISFFIDTGTFADPNIISILTGQGILVGIIGIIAIIPYIILFLPVWGNKKLSKLVSHNLSQKLIEIMTGSGINTLPLFEGEYFIEKESQVFDMSSSTGMFSMFGNGRLTTIIIIPLALISWIFQFTVFDFTENIQSEQLTVNEFFFLFTESMSNNQILVFSLIFVIPIVLTIILPLIFVLSDAEIKRSKWKFLDEANTVKGEILEVEDVGKTISNLVKIILGLGVIANMSNAISRVVESTNPINGWIMTSVILILGASLIFPGVLFMLYVYFGSGEHVRAVNTIRHHASQSDKIGVGTVDKNYEFGEKLSHPPLDTLTQF